MLEVFFQPVEVFQQMLTEISFAKKEICLQFYKIEDDPLSQEIRDLLIAALKRHVSIRILYDKDSYISDSFWDVPRNLGAQIIKYDAFLSHEHTKCLIADHTVIMGGINLQNYWKYDWLDYDIITTEKPFVIGAKDHFDVCWGNKVNYYNADGKLTNYNYDLILSSILFNYKEIDNKLISFIDNAKHEVLIASWCFVPSWALHKAIVAALKRGIVVRVVAALPKDFENNKGWDYQTRFGWKIQRQYLKFMKKHFDKMEISYCINKYWHGKTLVVDNDVAVIGSYNFNLFERYSNTRNLSVIIKTQHVINDILEFHNGIIETDNFVRI